MKCQCKHLVQYYKNIELTRPAGKGCDILSDFGKRLVCEFKNTDKKAKIFCRHYENSESI
jgi:hypothetical protein